MAVPADGRGRRRLVVMSAVAAGVMVAAGAGCTSKGTKPAQPAVTTVPTKGVTSATATVTPATTVTAGKTVPAATTVPAAKTGPATTVPVTDTLSPLVAPVPTR